VKHFFQKSKLTKLLLIGVFALSSLNSYSQSSSQKTVIVTGSRFEENLNEVPANVTVITRDEIANSTSQNVPDVLSQIGGLNVRSTNGGQLNLDATVDMGGYGATSNSTTLILVDGQKETHAWMLTLSQKVDGHDQQLSEIQHTLNEAAFRDKQYQSQH
jgi:iron complex outermembrane receptor protein